ncbi:DUF1830 domain-containing protein [Leptolyngbya sp. FACHB-261]|uniref:DUF1830 domain-containing protein n=1 Tax=Leptolyngbya sp. FACHB-261 TaxID=2692806 RepID=UPI001684F617|nr:DUF1830 domain-containing protein [Leptolyngbya sp. FACHB-261]MBD2104271.1 DUF1830 domain-containing protein [Leptolyngbya sp. FACHB-261]
MLIPTGSAARASTLIDCCYINTSRTFEIVRISEPASAYFERTVLPGQRLVFQAPAEAVLEIHTAALATAIHSDSIPCDQLKIQASNSFGGVASSAMGASFSATGRDSLVEHHRSAEKQKVA